MEYLTDTALCKVLFGVALLVGLFIGVFVVPRR